MKRADSIWPVATWLRDHLEEVHATADLAARAGLSERHFHRLFLDLLGETPAAHLQRLRLDGAAMWLAYTDFQVIDAAVAAGYDSREGFSRVFHRRFGCTPITFRRRIRAQMMGTSFVAPRQLGHPYELTLPPMRLAAWPHLGSAMGTVGAWLKLGQWGRRSGRLTEHTLAVSVLHDDDGITPSPHARIDAAVVLGLDQSVAPGRLPFVYDLPGGRHAFFPYSGSIHALETAWNYLAFRWLPQSGLVLRDTRMLMLHDPRDVPLSAGDLLALTSGRRIHCRLCIPIDSVPGQGLPPLKRDGLE